MSEVCGASPPKGSDSWWMNADQYDGVVCHCTLQPDHTGPHHCSHGEFEASS